MRTKYKKGSVVVAHSDLAIHYGWRRNTLLTIIGYYIDSHNLLNYKLNYHGYLSHLIVDDFLLVEFVDENFVLANNAEKLLYGKI